LLKILLCIFNFFLLYIVKNLYKHQKFHYFMKDKIYNLDLLYQGQLTPFAIKTIEELEQQSGVVADNPHRHNYYTVIWPFQAKGRHVIDFREYAIAPHQIFFVSPNQVHQVLIESGATGVVILFTPEFLQKNSIREDFISNLRLFRDSDETPPLPVPERMQVRLKMFSDQMLEAFGSGYDMRFETIGAYLKLFLIECNTHCSLFPEGNTQTLEVGRALVRNFKNLVENNFRRWHQVQEFADALHVSPNYLNEVIKSTINKSAKDYIQNRLMLEAKRMTLYTNKSVKEIGFELGFDDPSHFSKFFRNYTGISFVEFKESLQG
jgi:AraC family transcriptional regulator, transcriptional activator of pobA